MSSDGGARTERTLKNPNLPGVLVLAADAPRYAAALAPLRAAGVPVQVVADVPAALAAWAGEDVLLADPGRAAAAIDRLPGIRWVQSTWAGVRPLLEVARRDFVLTGVKDLFGPQMAEYVFGQLLARELRVVERTGHQVRGEWWRARSGALHGKTMGILGTGSIGRHIAGVARAFGLRCHGLNRTGHAAEGFDELFAAPQLTTLLSGCDYVVGVLPDTPATAGLLGAAAFRAMKRTACLVNVGRGSLVDEDALASALHSGTIGAAVLDVFRHEPLPQDSPLWAAPHLVITGHVAGYSRPEEIALLFERNYRRFAAGEPLEHVVDFARGY